MDIWPVYGDVCHVCEAVEHLNVCTCQALLAFKRLDKHPPRGEPEDNFVYVCTLR